MKKNIINYFCKEFKIVHMYYMQLRKIFTILFILFLGETKGQIINNKTIILVSHNVLAFSGHPKDIHKIDTLILEEAIKYYKNLNVDILVIQESPSEEYVRILAERLGFNYFFLHGKFKGNNEFPYGFPGSILTKFPIVEQDDFNIRFSNLHDTLFQRHWGGVTIRTNLGLMQLYSLHLCADWGGMNREKTRIVELKLLLKEIKKCDSCISTFVVGDFNSIPNSIPFKMMIENDFFDAHKDMPQPTVPIPNPRYKIDYVFYKKTNLISVSPDYAKLATIKELNLHLSDHIPCIIKIQINKE